MKRSRVYAWEGTGAQSLLPQEQETDNETMSEAPITDTENENGETDAEEQKGGENTSNATTAVTRQRRPDKPFNAPFIYTTMLNKREDMIFAGGAGKNEMRIFDFESGNIIAMIGNLPKSVLCGALANTSSQFAFGCADSRVRIFDINEQSGSSIMSQSSRSTARSQR